jgi:hypothetical protein
MVLLFFELALLRIYEDLRVTLLSLHLCGPIFKLTYTIHGISETRGGKLDTASLHNRIPPTMHAQGEEIAGLELSNTKAGSRGM